MSDIPSYLPRSQEQDRNYPPLPSVPFESRGAQGTEVAGGVIGTVGTAGTGGSPRRTKQLFKPPFPSTLSSHNTPEQSPTTDSAFHVGNNDPRTSGLSLRRDSLKHVAVWSQASLQRTISAAKPMSWSGKMPAQSFQQVGIPVRTAEPMTPQQQPVVMPPALQRDMLNALPSLSSQPAFPGSQPRYTQSVVPDVLQSNANTRGGSSATSSEKRQKAMKRVARQARLISPVSPIPFAHSRKELFLLFVLLASYLVTTILSINNFVNTVSMANYARGGIQHLLNVKNEATAMKAHVTNLDPNALRQMQGELAAARDDFQHLHDMMETDAAVNSINTTLPNYVSTTLALAQMGADASDIGQALVKLGIVYAPSLHGSLLADSTTAKPIVTPDMLAQTKTTLDYILPRLRHIQAQLPMISLDGLPLSVSQRDQISQILQYVPIAVTDATTLDNMMDAVGWILGVGQPRTFLVQTLDRSELRPTGGFTGQFGELSLNGARMAPFKLQNIGLFEDPPNGTSIVQGNMPPTAYSSWWPIANWGLRDSNLSADFPTSAQVAIKQYQVEFKHQVDGLIVFSPFLVARVLAATGPIYIPEYKETITSQNLEDRLHYYQLDNTGIRKEEIVEHVYDADQARKLFTARVLKDLQDTVRHAPISVLIGIGHEMLHALKTRDLQVYVSNPQIEALLAQYGADATLDRSTTHDGLFVVQANVSANKASQYVQTVLHDVVTLDAKGGATHVLQIRLVYHQVGQVYGPDTYHDYLRVYVPPSSQFLWGNGFEQIGSPLCGASAGFDACSTYDPYGDGDLLCPAGMSDPYVETAQVNDPYYFKNHPLNKEGPPTNTTSDEAQRAMYGGWVIVPKNCSLTVSLSWYVPPMGTAPYSLLVQRQSGTYPLVDVTLLPAPGSCGTLHTTGKHFDAMLDRDATYSIRGDDAEQGNANACYMQPGV